MSTTGRCRVCDGTYSGKQNHCTVCHQTFATERGGDSHRTGTYEPPQRRCRTRNELVSGGMWPDERGVWHGVWNKAGVQHRRTS